MKKICYFYLILFCIPICLLLFVHSGDKQDTLVILGTKLELDGTISPILKNRLDTALQVSNAHSRFIVTGKNEAAEMKRYLIAAGISSDRILIESEATNTYENIQNAVQLLPDNTKSFSIISSDFHLYRAQVIALDLGYETTMIHAKTPFTDRFYWQFRESLALLHFFAMNLCKM